MRAKLLHTFVAPALLGALFALPAVGQDAPAPTPPAAEAAPAPVENPVDGTLRLEAGDVFHYRQVNSVSSEVAGGATKVDSTQDMALTVDEKKEDGSYVIKVEIGRIHGSMVHPMFGTVPFDSRTSGQPSGNPTADMISKMTTAMAGRTLMAHVDARGQIHSVAGTESILDEVLEGNPQAPMLRPMLKDTYSEPTMKIQLSTVFPYVPEHPVGVGSEWKNERSVTGNGLVSKFKNTFALESADDQEVVVKAGGSLEASVDQASGMAAMQLAGFQLTDSKIDGRYRYSRKNGMPLGGESTTVMKAQISMGPMSTTTKTTLEKRETTDPAKAPAEEKPAPAPPVTDK